MFEAYTETARRAIFISRREAGRLGSDYVEVDHIVLGVFKADTRLMTRLFKSEQKLEEMRQRIISEIPAKAIPVSAGLDIPLSEQSKRVITQAAAAALLLNHKFIACEHLLLGVLSENTSPAAAGLREVGITADQLNEEAEQARARGGAAVSAVKTEGVRDLLAESWLGTSGPLVGRRQELEQMIQILSRRSRNNVVLLGEPGVGKDSLVRGLAKRVADGDVPATFNDRQIFQIEASKAALPQKLSEMSQLGGAVLYVRGLFDSRADLSALTEYLWPGQLQVIATGAPLSFRLAMERQEELVRHFEVVTVLPPTEEEAVEILTRIKDGFEKFHDVVISEEAIRTAVSASGRFLRHRALPDRAIDLIDDAGSQGEAAM